jgi:putative transposase
MIRTYKRKLILSKEQENRVRSWIGVCRLVYNLGLEIKIKSYNDKKQNVSKYDLMKQLTDLKLDYDWIKDVPSQSLQNAIERLDRAYQGFFKLNNGFPKYASKRKYKSILFKSVKVNGRYANLPKLGDVKMFKDSPILGVSKNATIIIEPKGIFICIQCEQVPLKFHSENQAVGIDMGIAHFCIDNNGGFIENPKHFKKYERKLRIENRALARKKKGSNRWKKQVKKLSILHNKVGNVRKDFLHKESTIIAKKHNVIYIENLNIKGMSKNKNLSKHILDCGWGMFRTMLEYKSNVVVIDPKYTSQMCSECGVIDKNNRVSQSKFKCVSCGNELNADVNGAKNIMSKGIALVRQREALACA